MSKPATASTPVVENASVVAGALSALVNLAWVRREEGFSVSYTVTQPVSSLLARSDLIGEKAAHVNEVRRVEARGNERVAEVGVMSESCSKSVTDSKTIVLDVHMERMELFESRESDRTRDGTEYSNVS